MVEVYDVHRALPLGGQMLHILRGLTFSIQTGEWVAITGPSGSGKSTLLGILAGIDIVTTGQVSIDGVEITTLSEGKLAQIRNQKIGIVFQSFHLIPTMTALENVEAPLYISPKRRQAQALAREMLVQVGLENRMDHLPYQLSGGEQQRVAIARALVAGPRLLLADEPTGNLDTATSKQVLALLAQLRQQLNLTIVMVTHDPTVAACADRSLHIVDGKLANCSERTAPVAVRSEAVVCH
jgi:putative ABC transport system ATP-binding protein